MINKLKTWFEPVNAATFTGLFLTFKFQQEQASQITVLCLPLFSRDHKITIAFSCPIDRHRQPDRI